MLSITLPGSKSITNRALLIASLAKGTSKLHHVLHSDDTKYMIEALTKLGIRFEIEGTTVRVHGGTFKPKNTELYIGNAGTAMRFLTSLLTTIPAKTVITGDERMQERPIKALVESLQASGCSIAYSNKEGYPPLIIKGNIFPGGNISISGKTSSQYLSSLMMIAPYAANDTVITITDELSSKPYVDITLDVMQSFAARATNHNYKQFTIPAHQRYISQEYTIEADASAASYFLAAAFLTNTPVEITNLGTDSKQGDVHFIELLEKLGATPIKESNKIGISCAKLTTQSHAFNMNTIPDVVQTLAPLAAIIPAISTITGIGTLRHKETDRILALQNELGKLGVKTDSTDDTLTIHGTTLDKLNNNVSIATYNDHRMAMSFAVLQLVKPDIIIENPSCVSKTYPHFWQDFKIFKQ
ncbi:MAG: 3-phosphoshikimate 1-carboxyvinyltransferase [bacterium]